jgi:hypothetical protein
VQRVPRPMLGGKALEAAQATLVGSALRQMSKPQQRVVVAEGPQGLTAAEQVSALVAYCPYPLSVTPLHSSMHQSVRQSL